MKPLHKAALLTAWAVFCFAAEQPAGRSIEAKVIPVPKDISPELQKAIAPAWAGSKSGWNLSAAEWKALEKQREEAGAKGFQPVKEKLHVTVTEERIAGVRSYRVKPQTIATENKNRLLVHVHGGGYTFGGGEGAAREASLAAYFGKIEVVSVDYRMPPDFPFPAAIDDSIAVWKEVTKGRSAKNVGLFGTSTGGGMTLAMVLKLKEMKSPLPGAIMAGTPWCDLTKTGDTFSTNEYVDNVLGSYDGWLDAAAKLYAGGHDLKEPLISHYYGDVKGFPPSILISGTRDLFLSITAKMHQKLLQSGNVSELLVFEGQSHAQYNVVDAPETTAAWTEVSKFFDKHLGN